MAQSIQPDFANTLNWIQASFKAEKFRSFNLRLAILKPNRFVTACMTFHDEQVKESEPRIFEYEEAILASLTGDIDMWLDFAHRLISGEFSLAGIPIPTAFSQVSKQENTYLNRAGNPLRESFLFFQTSPENVFSNKSLFGIGLPPFANLADASARYVHQLVLNHTQIQHEKTFVIALPIKQHVTLAEWLPGEIRVQLDEKSLRGYQLDFLFWEAYRVAVTESIPNPGNKINLPVPSRTTRISGHLLDGKGRVAQSFVLDAPYSFIGENKSSLSYEQQVRADILAGENENREMKAFFNPDQNKEMRDRVLHSAIAFANSSGGHIYIGVEDHGELSGNAKLTRIQKQLTNPKEAAREVSAKLKKYIVESTRPVIQVVATEIKIGSEWVVRLSIEESSQIVSTHNNDVFTRSGASNRKPDTDWFTRRAQNRMSIASQWQY